MDKYDFLMALSEQLQSIPQSDAQGSLDYYAEMIDDRIEEGLSEEEAVAAIGSPEEIARSILSDTLPAQPPEQPKKAGQRLRWWEITLLVLGFPVWFSLLAAVAAVVFSVWISLWSVVVSLYAAALALGIAALGCILNSFFLIGNGIGEVLMAWGSAFVCASLAILIFLLSNLAAKGMIALTKLIGKGIRRSFGRKEQDL